MSENDVKFKLKKSQIPQHAPLSMKSQVKLNLEPAIAGNLLTSALLGSPFTFEFEPIRDAAELLRKGDKIALPLVKSMEISLILSLFFRGLLVKFGLDLEILLNS